MSVTERTGQDTPSNPADTVVLVTGGSGFIASHLILQLLAAGYTVRTTVRSLAKEPQVRKSLEAGGATAPQLAARLTFYAADLSSDDGWADAVRGCTFVHHVASPFPGKDVKSEDELIVPARQGALRVLRAAQATGTIRRVVLTSSFAAIGYGHPASRGNSLKRPFTEDEWSVEGPGLPAYHKSKMLAEKAAWDYVEEQQKKNGPEGKKTIELAVVNPVGTFGPLLPGGQVGTSLGLIQRLLTGGMPILPQLHFGVVDARDVADLHMRAMTSPAARGQRFLAVADGPPASLPSIAAVIRKDRPAQAVSGKVPALTAPNWLMRGVALFDAKARNLSSQLGEIRASSNQKAKTVLGWQPRPVNETILATVDSLVAAGVV